MVAWIGNLLITHYHTLLLICILKMPEKVTRLDQKGFIFQMTELPLIKHNVSLVFGNCALWMIIRDGLLEKTD